MFPEYLGRTIPSFRNKFHISTIQAFNTDLDVPVTTAEFVKYFNLTLAAAKDIHCQTESYPSSPFVLDGYYLDIFPKYKTDASCIINSDQGCPSSFNVDNVHFNADTNFRTWRRRARLFIPQFRLGYSGHVVAATTWSFTSL